MNKLVSTLLLGAAILASSPHVQGEAALSVTHADGNRTTVVGVTGVESVERDGATVTTVTMRDKVYPMELKENYPLTYNVDYNKNTDYSSRVLRLTEVK